MTERQAARREVLAAALKAAPFEGWTRAMLDEVAGGRAEALRLFPGGPLELLDFSVAEADRQMAEDFAALDGDAMKVRERIATLVRLRLERAAPDREAIRRACTLLSRPDNAARAARQVYDTVDAIWRAAGDTSVDFNFYTKRALLAGVYSATLLYWLNDESDGFADTWDFLDRRIGDVMQIQKLRGRLDRLAERIPSPWPFIGRLRHRRS